jgi:hypothetical protein
VYEVWVNFEHIDLDALVEAFASEWLRLGDSPLATLIVADPVLVLGPEGTAPVPRSAFLAAVTARSKAVTDSADSITTLAGACAHSLGDRMVLATISWSFSSGDTATTLVSDFLLQREGSHPLRCVAYLPRTNVLDHLE